MPYDSLEPLATAGIWPWQIAAFIAGALMMILPALPWPTGKEDSPWFTALFTAGLVLLVASISTPQIVRPFQAEQVRKNAETVRSWAKSEYGVEIREGIAMDVMRDLDSENAHTDQFPAAGPDGDVEVRIEVVDGKLQLTSTRELPKYSAPGNDKP